jgi:hypothetical protein
MTALALIIRPTRNSQPLRCGRAGEPPTWQPHRLAALAG